MQEKTDVEYQGTVYTGHYFVEGINKRQLTVWYRGRKRVDNFDPRAEEPGYVESFAEQLLLEMVREEAAELDVR